MHGNMNVKFVKTRHVTDDVTEMAQNM